MLLALAAVSGARMEATGFRLPDQDAFATARGEAFAATADNASAIYYNPAGIRQLEGHNIRAGVYGLYLDPTYDSPNGRSFDNDENWAAVPQVFYAYSPEKLPVSFGFGAYAPYGLASSWPQDTGFRTVGTKGSLQYITLNPVAAVSVLKNLSIAAGLTVNYADLSLEQGMFWPAQDYDKFRFKGNGWDVGYNLGILFKPHEKVSLGVSFRSSTEIDLGGQTEYYNKVDLPLPTGGAIPAFPRQKVDSTAEYPFPLNAIFGVSFRPTPKWNLEFNADYADWSAIDVVTIKQARPFPPLIPQNVPVSLYWQPSWYYEFGGTRYFENGWSVSAGYIFNENSIPDKHYQPIVADLDRHFFSLGTGHKGKTFDFDVAYQFGYGPSRTVSGSVPSASGQSADGKYEFVSHAVFVSIGLHF